MSLINQIVTPFVIASSFPVVVLFLFSVMANVNKNYSYESYSIVAPIYFGVMNVVSSFIFQKETPRKRMLYTSIISAVIVCTFSTVMQTYTMTREKWLFYYLRIFIAHLFIWNVVIYHLSLLIEP